ncbi:cardiolipin synthase [Clostridium sp. 19966]|uniref:cardiolipin synthase n=1 Tax=Clostridium sp. 19966 TaxID=2768166 RepID=UPI0028DE6A2C|nr:cardiolipin synthase [Clostridium sp. 19966]MDT8715976.1 cardiolipin synthase [Clostridium sp. 19966]
MKFVKKLLFHRATFVFYSIAIQLLVLIWVIFKFKEYFVLFYGLSIVVSFFVILLILNNKSNPAYKIAWIIPILLFPIFGGLFYIFFGRNKLNRLTKKKMKSISSKSNEALCFNDNILEEIQSKSKTAVNQSRYIHNYANCPPYINTSTKYLSSGEEAFEKLKEELKNAKHFIFLEYFIINDGIVWNSILDILIDKVKAGVDVRLIYDDVGCLLTLPHRYYKKLERLGIKCCVFNPLIPLLSFRLNNRDHRKIAIIDGYTGFTGGMNLADEYINAIEKYGHWKDSAIMLKGEAVWSLTVIFLSMWDYLKGISEDFSKFRNEAAFSDSICPDGYVQPFADNPLDDEPVGEIVYLNMINKAKKYIYITTPYLIIGNEMTIALTSAAKSGVDVRIITPHIPDKRLVHSVTRSFYRILVESGVKIYEYTPGFMHSKIYVADDAYGVVGTINMDFRSLYLHFECGIWLYENSCIPAMKADFLKTLDKCRQITLEDIKSLKWYKVLIRLVLRVFAPLM